MSSNIAVAKATWIRLAVLSGVAVALFAYLGWQAGEATVPPGPPLRPTAWALPALPQEDPAKDLAAINARHPWSNMLAGLADPKAAAAAAAAGGAPPGAPPPPSWRLAGIIERADGRFALIATGAPGPVKYQYRSVGETLPDGSRLVEITTDNAVAQTAGPAGERHVYWLFRGKS